MGCYILCIWGGLAPTILPSPIQTLTNTADDVYDNPEVGAPILANEILCRSNSHP